MKIELERRSSFFGWVAVITAIIGLIVGIIFGIALESWWGALGAWAAFVSSVILYYALYAHFSNQEKQLLISAQILRRLETTAAMQNKAQNDDNIKRAAVSNSRLNIDIDLNGSANSNTNTWVCKECATENSLSSLTCKDCGTYK